MRNCKYIGTFIADNGNEYKLHVFCAGFIQALILLTANAIKGGRHYQLNNIEDEDGKIREIDDLSLIGNLIK